LKPVTQLYISVDASTKESLRKIDRPLFADFWERFLQCIESLAKKGQRTVFRMTLVKQWNMDEMRQYAELIERGRPSFVEIKGVTYCGTSKASSLTMQNVPFHEEVISFTKQLLSATPYMRDSYELACEHEHSCCLLLANKRFKRNGQWNTWIDYGRFHQLARTGEPFTDVDYMAPTPAWAVFGAAERGFDPNETAYRRNKPYQKGGC
jgi:tRNA wybutosine-synthesizing protein 1